MFPLMRLVPPPAESGNRPGSGNAPWRRLNTDCFRWTWKWQVIGNGGKTELQIWKREMEFGNSFKNAATDQEKDASIPLSLWQIYGPCIELPKALCKKRKKLFPHNQDLIVQGTGLLGAGWGEVAFPGSLWHWFWFLSQRAMAVMARGLPGVSKCHTGRTVVFGGRKGKKDVSMTPARPWTALFIFSSLSKNCSFYFNPLSPFRILWFLLVQVLWV